MSEAKNGDTVKVHYTGKTTKGEEFDSSKDRDPLEFQLGSGQIIPGFEKAVLGMKPSESTSVELAPDEAYGDYRDDLVETVDRGKIPQDLDIEVGQWLEITQSNGKKLPVVISEMDDSTVTLDANHPLAGKKLIFDIELVEIL